MTRAEKEQRICTECGAPATHYREFCNRCYKRHHRSDPAVAARDRAVSLRWKESNRERNRSRDREHGRHPCKGCGVLVSRQARLCQTCENERRCLRYPEIERLWLSGATARQIATALGTTRDSVHVTIIHMRQAGWNVPYRRTPEQVARIRAGSQRGRARAAA